VGIAHLLPRSARRTVIDPIQGLDTILNMAQELLATVAVEEKKVRLLGITVSNWAREKDLAQNTEQYEQLTLSF
jgi:hypothetical protein